MTDGDRSQRRAYRRLQAPVYFSRDGLRMFRRRRVGSADPLGGLCVYSDEHPREGIPLKLEVFLPDGTSVNCRAEVAWVDTLPDGAPARCDIGLKLTAINPQDRDRLSSVLEQVRP